MAPTWKRVAGIILIEEEFMRRIRKEAIFGCLCALALLAQVTSASAMGLSVSTTANYSPFDPAANLSYTGRGFSLANDGLPISGASAQTTLSPPSFDSQTAGFAFATTAGNPFDMVRFAEATGQVFDDWAPNATATSASFSGPVSSSASALFYQPFTVSGDGTMTYAFDYNFFMASDPTPGGTAAGLGNVFFQLGLFNQNGFPILFNYFADSASGTDMDSTLSGLLTWNFTDGQTGFFAAYADASARVDAVPEPSTIILLVSGLAGLAVCRRRKGASAVTN
jgi:hypothetical protein